MLSFLIADKIERHLFPQHDFDYFDRDQAVMQTGSSTLAALKIEGSNVSVAGQRSTYIFNCVRDGQMTVVQPMGMR